MKIGTLSIPIGAPSAILNYFFDAVIKTFKVLYKYTRKMVKDYDPIIHLYACFS